MEYLDIVIEKTNLNRFEHIKPLKNLADKAGLQVAHLLLIAIFIAFLFMMIEIGDNIICLLVGFLYPAYMSFKVIEDPGNKDGQKLWLTYWVVFSIFTVFDEVLHFILSFLPFYYLIKTAFLVFLFHPRTKGAQMLYDQVIAPTLEKYEDAIDDKISMAKEKISDLSNKKE